MYCKRCRYDLRSQTDGRCPECGRGFDPSDPRSYLRTPDSNRILRTLAGIIGCVVALFAVTFTLQVAAQPGDQVTRIDAHPHPGMAVFLIVLGIQFARIRDRWCRFFTATSFLLIVTLWPALALTYYLWGGIGEIMFIPVIYAAISLAGAVIVVTPNRAATAAVSVVLAGLCLLIVPFQLVAAISWRGLHREAVAIMAHAEAERTATGAYPADLDSYAWLDPSRASRIEYTLSFAYDRQGRRTDRRLAMVIYDVRGFENTGQLDSDGGWFMYDD